MNAIGLILVLLVVGTVLAWASSAARRRSARARLDDWLADGPEMAPLPRERPWLVRWLGHAGYGHRGAAVRFLVAQASALALGGLLAWTMTAVGLTGQLMESMSGIPGGVGDAFTEVLSLAPWIVFLIVTAAPVLWVRAARRRVIRETESDLPLVLEIFATLAEAGLGFDASLMRLLDATPQARPLNLALRYFQRDVQAGVPRVQALRQIASRLDVPAVTVFVSALVQAEQAGASIAGTLRRQADDTRDRRRERVALLGQLLPVKLMFPLVVCFLPGIFVTTLGPALLQMVEVAGGFLRSGR